MKNILTFTSQCNWWRLELLSLFKRPCLHLCGAAFSHLSMFNDKWDMGIPFSWLRWKALKNSLWCELLCFLCRKSFKQETYQKRRYKLIVRENFVLHYPDVWLQVGSSQTGVTVFSEWKDTSFCLSFLDFIIPLEGSLAHKKWCSWCIPTSSARKWTKAYTNSIMLSFLWHFPTSEKQVLR